MIGVRAGNIFDHIPAAAGGAEFLENLLVRRSVRIERIVSSGHASPPGFWYDQAWNEWVIVLRGSAGLRLEDEAEVRSLEAGDYVFIPARRRHRVDWTSESEPTVWLAVHFDTEKATS
jgi:cupin 2 domain-containing protein